MVKSPPGRVSTFPLFYKPIMLFPEALYENLLGKLLALSRQSITEEKELEAAFGICIDYMKRINGWLKEFQFRSEADEISFFKSVRPRFGGLIEYYKKRYHALLFRPRSRNDLIEFWDYEITKLDKFFSDNKTLYTYFQNGATDKDRLLFLRNGDKTIESEIDTLLALFIGAERYRLFVLNELEEL